MTLDLLTKRHKLYYIGWCITIPTISFIAIMAYLNANNKASFNPLYDVPLIICSLISTVFIVIVGTGILGTYHKDGELVLTDKSLVIDKITIPIGEIKYINLKMAPRNIKSWVLDKNLITVGDKNGNEYKRRFAIKSYNQNEEFEKILDLWRSQDVGVYTYYNGI